MKTLDALVAESPVFAGLDQAYLELIVGCAPEHRLRGRRTTCSTRATRPTPSTSSATAA